MHILHSKPYGFELTQDFKRRLNPSELPAILIDIRASMDPVGMDIPPTSA
jgi:hypothetical protein